jgi:hypothetical protein
VSSPIRRASSTGESVTGFPDISNLQCKLESPLARAASGLSAFSFQFVAKPEQARNAVQLLPGAIHSGLEDMAGFAGSLVMVSDQEARLITVIIFWSGSEVCRGCERSVSRIRALLAPYLDRCLRVQNLFAHFPAQQERYSQAGSIDTHLIADDSIAQEANVCVA